ncbi:hypothetical protein [Achromobacter insuavis]|uniref:hypothetical protein n=1 Tax=Achromobacter insuavis TaxID=1287735 RepID=UPI001F134111|nr:hypothetical protein [Achromobacter insuavis]
MKNELKSRRKTADSDWLQERLDRILAFLRQNTQWNRKFQESEYARCLSGCSSARDRLVSFLHLNVSTQSRVDMDGLTAFWQRLHRANDEQTSSLRAFTAYLQEQGSERVKKQTPAFTASEADADEWAALFLALNAQGGWGIKTTALFVKAAIRLHEGPKHLHFWPDATSTVGASLKSKPYLPVDRVILHIFRTLGLASPRVETINARLRARYSADEMLIWDDLWFWGFFTQEGNGENRTLGWNPGKFWHQLSSPKCEADKLELLCLEFLKLLEAAPTATIEPRLAA